MLGPDLKESLSLGFQLVGEVSAEVAGEIVLTV